MPTCGCRAKFDKFIPRLADKIDPHSPVPFGEMFGQGIDDLIGQVMSCMAFHSVACIQSCATVFGTVQFLAQCSASVTEWTWGTMLLGLHLKQL